MSITDTPSCVDIVLILGPRGSGKNSVADSCQNPSTLYVDGNVLNLDHDTVAKLGDHRNEFTMWMIVKTILEGKVPIVALSGGALLDRKGTPLLVEYIKSVFGITVNINITLLLPMMYAPDVPDASLVVLEGDDKDQFMSQSSPLNEVLCALYNSKAGNSALEKEHKKNVDDYRILLKLLKSFSSVVRKVIFFPKSVDQLSDAHREGLNVALQHITPPRIEKSPRFTQKRFLITYETSEGEKSHHITLEYSSGGVPFTTLQSDLLQTHIGKKVGEKKVVGKLMICPSTTFVAQLVKIRETSCRIIDDVSLHEMIPSPFAPIQMVEVFSELVRTIDTLLGDFGCLQDDTMKTLNYLIGKTLKLILETSRKNKVSNVLMSLLEDLERQKCLKLDLKGQLIQFIIFPALFEGELGTRAHITVNHGKHKPADMRTAAQHVYSGAPMIQIDSDQYEYNTGLNVNVEILQIYYI